MFITIKFKSDGGGDEGHSVELITKGSKQKSECPLQYSKHEMQPMPFSGLPTKNGLQNSHLAPICKHKIIIIFSTEFSTLFNTLKS